MKNICSTRMFDAAQFSEFITARKSQAMIERYSVCAFSISCKVMRFVIVWTWKMMIIWLGEAGDVFGDNWNEWEEASGRFITFAWFTSNRWWFYALPYYRQHPFGTVELRIITGRPFEDGQYILYVNGEYRGDSDIGKISGTAPTTKRNVTVDSKIKSRHTANAVLKQSGIEFKF